MFNLEQAIAKWRRQMIAAGIKSKDILDELESHLREDFDQQLQSGLTNQEAFEAAVQHIGQAAALQSEFSKLPCSKPKLRSGVFRAACFATAILMFLINTVTLVQFETGPLERILALFTLSLIALYIGILPYCYNWVLRLPLSGSALKTLSLIASLWVIACLLGALNLIHFEVGITFCMLAWSLLPAILVTGLAHDFFFARVFRADSFPLLVDFSPIAQSALELACQEASHLNHDFNGTEHLLLGLLTSENNVVPKVLQRMGVTANAVTTEITKLIGPSPEAPSNHSPAYTPRAKKALQLAAREAKTLNHPLISCEAIFLGLIVAGEGLAAVALKNLGVNAEASRRQIVKELGH